MVFDNKELNILNYTLKIWCLESNWESRLQSNWDLQSICLLKLNLRQWIIQQIHTGGLTLRMCYENARGQIPDFYQGTKGLHLPTMLWASASDKQLTGNFLGSDINRQSRVPLIRAHMACEVGLVNLKPSRSARNEMFLEGADTLNDRYIKWELQHRRLINHANNTDGLAWRWS